jgi:hypothetical protein
MSANHLSQEPYHSVDELRRANDELLLNMPKDDSPSAETERSAAEAARITFIRRAIETGAVLDRPADRRVAQGLIDYWVVSAYAASDAGDAKPPPFWGVKALLKPFDATFMRQIADRGDVAVRNLDQKGQALARRILLGLVRFSDGSWVSEPKRRDALLSAADKGQENEIIEQLQKEGALMVTSRAGGELVELRYEALLRHWETLHRWVGERANFHEDALSWVRNGKKKSELLSVGLSKSAAQYGDLESVEWEFINESLNYARRWRWITISVAALLFLIPSIAFFLAWYSKVYIPHKGDELLKTARYSYTDPKERVQIMGWLAEHGLSFDFSDRVLRGKIFDLEKLRISQANFRQSILEDINFAGARLVSAHFDNAYLQNIKFTQANLSGSVFDQAQLCDVDLSGADLTGASFLNVSYEQPPNLKDTAWWLSTGWDLQQVDLFRKQQGVEQDPVEANNRERLKQKDKTYLQTMEGFNDTLTSSSKGSLERMVALDGMAWTRAQWGLELADAEKNAREAETIMRSLNRKLDVLTVSYVADTLGYILLQMDRAQEARKWLETASQAKANPGAMFRYALALHIMGDESEAEQSLKTAMGRGYWPSSELLLLNRYFSGSGSFVTTFAKLTEKRQTQTGPVCWLTKD